MFPWCIYDSEKRTRFFTYLSYVCERKCPIECAICKWGLASIRNLGHCESHSDPSDPRALVSSTSALLKKYTWCCDTKKSATQRYWLRSSSGKPGLLINARDPWSSALTDAQRCVNEQTIAYILVAVKLDLQCIRILAALPRCPSWILNSEPHQDDQFAGYIALRQL